MEKAGNKIKVVVGIPTIGFIQAEAAHSMWAGAFHMGVLQCVKPDLEFTIAYVSRMLPAMNRERIADKALSIGADYIFMFDDDMILPPDTFEKLYRHDVDVCGALAFTRNPPHLPVLYEEKTGWDKLNKREYFTEDWVMNYPKNKLVECDAVGFGCVLIKTSVLKRMEPPYFMCSSGTGEDIYFCIQAKRAGARIFMDTSAKIGHLSNPSIIDEDTHEKFNDPKNKDLIYGAYKKYGVYDIGQLPSTNGNKEEEVLSR